MMNEIKSLTTDNFQGFLKTNKFDIFICSSSFEKRCQTIPKIIGNQVKNVLICQYEDNYQMANDNYNELLGILKSPIPISFGKNNPLKNIDNLASNLHDLTSKLKSANILVDITTFTREMIFILIYFFRNEPSINEHKVTFIYNPAGNYSMDKDNISEKWLSKGVRDIRSVLGYSGLFSPNKKLALILLVGFEQERAKKIIDTFEPSKVFLGHASIEGAISEDLQVINKNVFDELKSLYLLDMCQFQFSCKTPSETKEKIDEIIKSSKNDYNIVIASLNNKISSIGVAFSALENPEVQICYPTVNHYNIENYSVPTNDVYLIEINS